MLTLDMHVFFFTTCVLFNIGIIGVILNRKNLLMVLISIELILLSINLNFAVISVYLDDIVGQIYVIFILTIAAVESAVGLSMLTVIYRLKNNIDANNIKRK